MTLLFKRQNTRLKLYVAPHSFVFFLFLCLIYRVLTFPAWDLFQNSTHCLSDSPPSLFPEIRHHHQQATLKRVKERREQEEREEKLAAEQAGKAASNVGATSSDRYTVHISSTAPGHHVFSHALFPCVCGVCVVSVTCHQ